MKDKIKVIDKNKLSTCIFQQFLHIFGPGMYLTCYQLDGNDNVYQSTALEGILFVSVQVSSSVVMMSW